MLLLLVDCEIIGTNLKKSQEMFKNILKRKRIILKIILKS